MTSTSPSQPSPEPAASRRGPGSPLSHPLGDGPAGAGLQKPRVKMLETSGDLTPAGATYTAPAAAPLPERGTGIHLLLSVLAAIIAVVFLVLLLQKL